MRLEPNAGISQIEIIDRSSVRKKKKLIVVFHTNTGLAMAASGSECALSECSKPPAPSLDPDRPHLTCCKLHHQLLMAARFHPHLAHPPHRQIFDRNAARLCALLSCTEPPCLGDYWCSRPHKLAWLVHFTSRLNADQICQLPGCVRHVFVDEDHSCWRFCGWRHWQKHVMQSARQCKNQKLCLQQQKPSVPSSFQRNYGYGGVETRICSLKAYAFHGITPTDIILDEDFFHKHPWEVCRGGETSWVITAGAGRKRGGRVTKDGCHWKQQGRSVKKDNGYTLKYFTYKKLGGMKIDVACRHCLEEYTIDDVHGFVLLKVHKGSARCRKHCKVKECAGAEADYRDSAGEANTVSRTHDGMDMDIFWDCLSPLTSYSLGEFRASDTNGDF